MTKTKKKAYRSKEEKENRFNEIIEVGRELFVSKGTYGFSTHALAKKLNMSQANLYTYVKSKRELWIAIRIQDFEELKRQMQKIVDDHDGSTISLLLKLGDFYLDFANEEYRRFQMMFIIPLPPSDKEGPIEEEYRTPNPLDVVRNVLRKGMEAGEIKKWDVENLAYYLYSLYHGAISVERDIRSNLKSPEKFKNFLKEKLVRQLKPENE